LAPNLLAVGIIHKSTEIQISWMDWLIGVAPVGLLLLVPLPWVVYRVYPPEIRSSPEVPLWAASELGKMGPLSVKEWLLGLLIIAAVVLWIFGTAWINPTTVVLVVLAVMLLTRIIDWADVTRNSGAWDMLVFFATLLTLADGLNQLGVIKWVSTQVSALLAGYPPRVVMVALVVFFFVIHYLFASLTAHVTAILPPLVAVGAGFPGMPVRAMVLLLAYSLGLMGVLTPYATGPACAYYGSGYIARKEFWRLGFIFGLIYLAVLLGAGMPYLLWLDGGMTGEG
jgi:L-tartrate/succinate antiporter